VSLDFGSRSAVSISYPRSRMPERGARRGVNLALSTTIVGGAFFVVDFLGYVELAASVLALPLLAASAGLYFGIDRFSGSGWSKLALLLGSLVAAICLGEALFRGFLLEPYVPDNDARFEAMIASSWPRPVRPRPSDEIRLVGLADSFGRAGGEENYHIRVEQLAASRGTPLEVVNLSHASYDLPDELLLFRRFAARYEPDVVLHGMFVGNDFSVPLGILMDYNGIQVRARSGRAMLRPISFTLGTWSQRLLRVWTEDARKRENATDSMFSEETFLDIETSRLRVARTGAQVHWAKIERWLDEIRAETEALGATYVLVIHPDQFQVESDLRGTILARSGEDPADFDFDLPQRFLLAYCERREIPCIDLLPVFRANGSDGGLYLERDTHYNERGNELAAATIYDVLQTGLLTRAHTAP
jgi:hypothetical protein